MLAFYVFLAILISILCVSSYAYKKIDNVTIDSKVSEKLLLSTLVISSTILFFCFFFVTIKYIDLQRCSNLLSFGTLITSVLLMLSYGYLDKEKKSGKEYEYLENQLKDNENNTNKEQRNMSLILGIIGLSIVGAYLFIIIGKVFYSTERVNTITVKEPLIINSVDEKPLPLDQEQLRKKFYSIK